MTFKYAGKTAKYDYSSAQIALPQDMANQVKSWGEQFVKKEDLYRNPAEGAMGLEVDPHVTVRYGLHTTNPAQVDNAISHLGSVEFSLGKVSRFHAAKYDVIKVEVVSKDLHKLNSQLGTILDCTDTHPTYNPHVTIAYVKKGRGPQEGLDHFEGMEGSADRIEFSSKSGEKYNIELEKHPMQKISEALMQDIEAAVITKLAGQRRKKSKTHKIHYDDYAARGGTMATGALMASIMDDIKNAPITPVKERLYSLVGSVAGRMLGRQL